jgi:hypothetical protein
MTLKDLKELLVYIWLRLESVLNLIHIAKRMVALNRAFRSES